MSALASDTPNTTPPQRPTHDPSRWWYGLLPFPVLVGVRYLLVGGTRLLLPTAAPSRSEALPVLLLAMASVLVGALVVVSAPIFAASALLDIRTLRDRSPWTPRWAYAVIAAVPLLGLVVEWLALVSIPVALAYLVIRRRRVGTPFGRGRQPAPVSDVGSPRTTSKWVYGVAIPPALELVGAGVLWAVRTGDVLQQGSDPLALLVPAALVLTAVALVPVFAASLYLDARAVGADADGSRPDPRLWGLGGLGALAGLAVFRVSLMLPIALAYGYRRSTAT